VRNPVLDSMMKKTSKRLVVACVAAVIIACLGDAVAEIASAAVTHDAVRSGPILVVGSINMDTIIDVQRLPTEGETITTRRSDTGKSVPGGKGANQAVAVARMAAGTGREAPKFVCQLGNDAHAKTLEQALLANGVDISLSGVTDKPSGQGIVFLLEDGTVSSVVVGGSNAAWPEDVDAPLLAQIRSASAVLLQREIPEHVNVAVATAANAAKVPVFQDMGGADRPISDELLKMLALVSPNLSELERMTGMPTSTEEEILQAARSIQARGAKHVLVTRGEDGALLLTENGQVLKQERHTVSQVVDETGAGDSFRAAFTVAFVEGRPLQECLQFASAAGAAAVTVMGAFPSLPSREQCERIQPGQAADAADTGLGDWLGSRMSVLWENLQTGFSSRANRTAESGIPAEDIPFPKMASRVNSMKARRDLMDPADSAALSDDPDGWIRRQGAIDGLELVDLNFPQHFRRFPDWRADVRQIQEAAGAAGLAVGAVSLRYPEEDFYNGAFTNPDPALRRRAVELTVEGGRAAKALGAAELVVWSAFDGYDYPCQADYTAAWQRTVEAFRKVCDAHPELRVMVEYKPTDEATRFSIVGSAGAAALLVEAVGRANMGVMLDVGHALMAGESPAQSAALLGARLFGVHLNDGWSRLGAEDGLALASVHPSLTLELFYWLQRIRYQGHLFMDTFPRKEDPLRECEFNVRRAKTLWRKAQQLRQAGLDAILARHDALAALELMEQNGAL